MMGRDIYIYINYICSKYFFESGSTKPSQDVQACASFLLLSFAAFPFFAGADASGAGVFRSVATERGYSHAMPKSFSNRRYSSDGITTDVLWEKTVESNPKNITVHWNLCLLFLRIVLLALARSSFLTRGYTVCKGWYIKWWDDQKCWKTSFQIEDNANLTS